MKAMYLPDSKMEKKEKDIPAYLDYFAVFCNENEKYSADEMTTSCVDKETVCYESQDEEYKPEHEADDVADSDTISSDDCEWLPGKRRKNSVKKRTKRRKQRTAANEYSSTHGVKSVFGSSEKAASGGSSQKVGFVKSPQAAGGGQSKTILRNILETPPSASLNNNLQSQRSKGIFFSPSLQALLMNKADSSSEKLTSINSPNPIIQYNSDSLSMSNESLLNSPVPIDKTGNIVSGSASSLLMAMLKKAHANSQNVASSQSSRRLPTASVTKTGERNAAGIGFSPIGDLLQINRPSCSKIRPSDDVRLAKLEEVDCDICKRRSSATVSLRLPSFDKGVAVFKQWRVCEWCEVKLVGVTPVDNPTAPQRTETLNSSISENIGHSKEERMLLMESDDRDSREHRDKSNSPKNNCYRILLDALLGSKQTDNKSEKNTENADNQGTPILSTHRRKGKPKKITRNISDSSTGEMENNHTDSSNSNHLLDGVLVKTEPPDDLNDHLMSMVSSESCTDSKKLKELGQEISQSAENLFIKQEPVEIPASQNCYSHKLLDSKMISCTSEQMNGDCENTDSKYSDENDEIDKNLRITFAQESSEFSIPSTELHSEIVEDKTFGCELTTFPEKKQTCESGIQNSVLHKMLSGKGISVKSEPVDSEEPLGILSETKETTCTASSGLVIKKEPLNVSDSTTLRETLKMSVLGTEPVLKSGSHVSEGSSRSDFWASNLLQSKTRSTSCSMPKSSSLLLQQLCKSHHTKTENTDNSSSQNLSSVIMQNGQPVVTVDHSLPTQANVKSLVSPGSYNLSNLLRQLSYKSAMKKNMSADQSLLYSGQDNRGRILQSVGDVDDKEKPRTMTFSKLLLSSLEDTKQSSHTDLSAGKWESPALSTETVSELEKITNKPDDKIQPGSVFCNENTAHSENGQKESKGISVRTVDSPDLETSESLVCDKNSKKSSDFSSLDDDDADEEVIDTEGLNQLKPFVCMKCSESFESSKSLRIHMRYHEQEKAYGCGICGRKYSTNGVLKKHILTYHTQKSKHSAGKKKKN